MKDALGAVQRVLLLGGTSDIGLATVAALAGRGRLDEVVLAARDPAAAEARARQTAGLEDVAVATFAFDALAEPDEHAALVDKVFSQHGDIDVVVLAFGALGDQRADEHDNAAAVRLARINYVGAVSVGLPLADRLVSQGHGALVVLSSVAAERARRSNFLYGSAKAGLDAFAQGLAQRVDGSGVQVLTVRPGFVRTRMTAGMDPAPLATDPAAVADTIVGGLDRGARVVYAPRPLRAVASVLRHLPTPVFDAVARREAEGRDA